MSEPDQQSTPASFYASPAEARRRPGRGVPVRRLPARGHGRGASRTSSRWWTPRRDGSCTDCRCRTSATSCITSAGTAAAPPATGPDRSHLIVPGFRSSRIHIVNVADDPRRPRIEKVIEPGELVAKTGLTRPHTVHCMPGENIVISMLGDADGNGACGFAVLDAQTFEVKGRWENGGPHPQLNYDFWYQPRQNVLASSEFGEPNAYEPGSTSTTSAAGRYGSRLHFWNLAERTRRADGRARRQRAGAAGGALAARPRRRRGLRRRRAVVHDVALPPRQRLLHAPTR